MTLRAVDLSQDVAGGFCAKLLAMNGIETTRVDSLDQSRRRPHLETFSGGSTGTAEAINWLDHYLHRGKHRVDAGTSPDEVAEVFALIAGADLVVTSFDGGRYAGPLDEERLRSITTTAVHVTTSSFGTEGPYSKFKGSSLVDWAAGGYLYITGEPDKEPLSGPANLCGYVCGYTAAIAAEAALLRRRPDRPGQHVDISTMEAMLSVHQSTFSRLGAGVLRTRTGRYTEVYPLIVQPCSNGYVSIGVVSDDEFDRLSIAMERPELAADPRFATQSARQANFSSLDPILVRWLADKEAEDVVQIFQSHGIPAAAVATAPEVLVNPQLDARGFWKRTTVGGAAGKAPGNPLQAFPARKQDISPAKNLRLGGGELPLGGDPQVTVLDLTAFWAGPSATRNLADLGARVIRVERPGSRAEVVEQSDSAKMIALLFDQKMNRNKESVVINLKSAKGREIFLSLVEEADVLVENFRAGAMASLQLDYPHVSARNPSIIYVALSGFGGRGPWSHWKSYGPTIEAASSIEDRTGYPGGHPMRLGHTLPDGVGGLVGTLAALVGLRDRRVSGQGVFFDLSQLEAYCVLSGETLLAASLQGTTVGRIGNRNPLAAPHGVYPTRGDDEWIAIAVESDDEWRRLVKVIEDPKLASDAFATAKQRVASQEHIDDMIKSHTVRWNNKELALKLQEEGVPAFPVMKPADFVSDIHLKFRGYFTETIIDDQTIHLPGSPLHCSPAMVRVSGKPPDFGEHTMSILGSLLGMSLSDISQLGIHYNI